MNNLICFGLVLIPYLSILGFHSREPRLMLALFITLALSIIGINKIELNKRSLIIGIFLLYTLFASWQAPRPLVIYNGINIANFYLYKPLLLLFTYSFALIAIINTKLDIVKIRTVIVWTSTIMAIHAIGQSFGLNQWFKGTGNLNQISGFLGNRAVLASWLAICLPFSLKEKKYWNVALILIAILLTRTQIPIFATLVGLITYFSIKKPIIPIITLLLLVGLSIVDVTQSKQSNKRYLFKDSYRLSNWKNIVSDTVKPIITGKSYVFTGRGLGSFKYLYHTKYKNNYVEAHNEYLEVFYELGLYGIILICAIIYIFVFNRFPKPEETYLFSSLVIVLLIAGGLFIWQLGITSFYILVILGIYNNKETLCHS